MNGSTCVEHDGNEFTCTCAAGYTGQLCETSLFCVPDPCKHGGTCNENTESCECPANYTGNFCETYLHCSSNPCQNNQQCIEGTNTFRCNCTGPYEGVQCELDIRCQFPTRWLSTWFLNPTFALNFAVNQMYELPSPTATPAIATNTFNCESYKESALTQGVRYFARSNIRDIHTETCTKGFQSTNLFLHWEDQLIQDATPPTAEYCEINANLSFMPDIYVKYPFDYSTGTCLDFAAGRYEVVYSRRIPNQGLCANNSASIAVISPNSIQFIVCEAGGVEAILRQTLDCVGRISSNFIDPATDEIIVFQVRGSVSQVSSFYCGRIREDLNNRRLLLSLDLTPTYSQITCLTGISSTTAIDTPPARQIRAFNLKRVYCFSSPCMNGSTCVEHDGDEFTCTCTAGYTGQLCETDIDECRSNPCLNDGTCTDMDGAFVCTCPTGYYAVRCESYNPCIGSLPCQNGGACISEASNNYTCNCPDNFVGINCETEVFCYSHPCLNSGTCMDIPKNFQCDCPDNFIGTQCETELHCFSIPCQNAGLCQEVDPSETYTCTCRPNFTGLNCETRLYCVPQPCQHGGTCLEVTNDYACNCPLGFTGRNCETRLFCVSEPCQNGGICTELSGTGYGCTCPATPITFTGTNCETRLFCTPTSPCINGGTCSERPSTVPFYICTCPLGFSGDNCTVEGDCAFPNSWIGNWYVEVNQYVEFTTNKIYYKSTPSENPQNLTGSYHCEDFYASTGVGDWWFYVRSPLAAPTNEACLRVHRDNKVLVHFDGFNGAASDPPTAEQCEGTGSMANYTRTPVIMIRHPFNFTTTSCFAQYTGQYFAQVSTLCGNPSMDMYTSKVTIADSSLTVDTCRVARTEPLFNTRLMCVGLIDARYIGDDLTDPVIILAEYDAPAPTGRRKRQTGSPDNFFCARIRNSLDDQSNPRIYLSIDITPRSAIECLEGYTAVSTSPSSPTIRALELTPVFCQPSDPCLNDGTCREMNGQGYQCICLPFFTGRNCETGSDGCANDPCLNNGNCTTLNMMGDYQCTCPARFIGENCGTEIFCTGVVCQNSGTCTEQTGNYQCQCVAGYTGLHCEADINECASNPCQNAGSCNNMVNSYSCTCVGGTSGVNCATIDGCFSNPCMNGATCRTTNTNGSYVCTCVAGYTGSRCETDINECASSPCVNGGTCLNRINSYECQCPSGYSGSTCQYINGCRSTPCQNGGTCTYNVTSTRDTYACQCTFEYTGTNCEARLWCAGVMCLNGGTCQAVTNNYTCLCAEDYIGRHCGEQVQAVVAEEEDEGFDWTIFAIVVGVIGGLIALAVFIGGIYCCLAMGREEPRKQQLVQSQPFVQAYPIVSPTYIAASPVSTLMAEQSNAQLGAITYTSGPSLYGGQMNVRNATLSTIYGRGGDGDSEHGIVAEPPPRISLRNGGGSYAGSRSAANSIRIMGANGTVPGAGILVNRQSMEPRTEGSLMGKLIDAEFRPYD